MEKIDKLVFYKVELKSMVLLLSVDQEKKNREWLLNYSEGYTLNKAQRFEP